MTTDTSDSWYRGRFAPSPTGPLHIGSLYTAVASFIDARAHNGQWLLRIDDLDPLRCKSEHASQILKTLEQYALYWDEDVFYQQTRYPDYQYALDNLRDQSLVYPCRCSRKELEKRHINKGIYDAYCFKHPPSSQQASAMRIKLLSDSISFNDQVQGPITQSLKSDVGDFIIYRKDKIASYHLAVALDDAEQRITHIVRGHDLLDSTARQIYLQQQLHLSQPNYAHIPVLSDINGDKLSKRTGAEDVALLGVNHTLIKILGYLNFQPPAELVTYTGSEILDWAINHWSMANIKPRATLTIPNH